MAQVPKVIDYDIRLGDPETQSLLPLLSTDTDLAEVIVAFTEHRLDTIAVSRMDIHCITLVACAKVYPGTAETGHLIEIKIPKFPNSKLSKLLYD